MILGIKVTIPLTKTENIKSYIQTFELGVSTAQLKQ